MRDTSRKIRRMRREKAVRAYRRAVLKRLAAAFAALAVTAVAGVSAINTVLARGTGAVYTSITVEKGDTLWKIAAEHNCGGRDVRTVVDEIMRVNGLESTRICAGDRISVPLE